MLVDWVKKRLRIECNSFKHPIKTIIFYEDQFIIHTLTNKCYKFDLGNNYPFNPPESFYINDRLIQYSKYAFPSRIWDLYQSKYKECICCNNKLCSIYWSPSMTINHIVNEYDVIVTRMKNLYGLFTLETKYVLPYDISFYIYEFLK